MTAIMKSALVHLFIVSLCINQWIVPSESARNIQRRGKNGEDYDVMADAEVDAEDALEDADGVGTDERFHHFGIHRPLHHFMKKKRPFVSFSTRTETSTISAVVTVSTVGLCAKLVNVTGPCRLRRGLWVEDPIVMTFDDDMDAIDGALLPSATLSIETTATPDMKSTGRSGIGDDSGYLSSSVIQSSTTSTTDSGGEDGSDEDEDENQRTHGLLTYLRIKHLLKKRVKLHLITVVTTSISSVTSTSTSYITASIKTFFIQLCTPSPFPFNVCDGRKKREADEDH